MYELLTDGIWLDRLNVDSFGVLERYLESIVFLENSGRILVVGWYISGISIEDSVGQLGKC